MGPLVGGCGGRIAWFWRGCHGFFRGMISFLAGLELCNYFVIVRVSDFLKTREALIK